MAESLIRGLCGAGLAAELFAGRRASYVSPFRLYLVFSVIAFAAAAFVANRNLVATTGDEIIFVAMTIDVLLPPVTLVRTGPNSSVWDFDSPLAIARFALGIAVATYALLAFRTAYRGGWTVNVLRAASVVVVYQLFMLAFQLAMFRMF